MSPGRSRWRGSPRPGRSPAAARSSASPSAAAHHGRAGQPAVRRGAAPPRRRPVEADDHALPVVAVGPAAPRAAGARCESRGNRASIRRRRSGSPHHVDERRWPAARRGGHRPPRGTAEVDRHARVVAVAVALQHRAGRVAADERAPGRAAERPAVALHGAGRPQARRSARQSPPPHRRARATPTRERDRRHEAAQPGSSTLAWPVLLRMPARRRGPRAVGRAQARGTGRERRGGAELRRDQLDRTSTSTRFAARSPRRSRRTGGGADEPGRRARSDAR